MLSKLEEKVLDFAIKAIESNPNVMKQPNTPDMLNVLKSRDPKQIEDLATNISNGMGMSVEEAGKQAMDGLNLNQLSAR